MGLRSLQVPANPQPQNLPPPIPGQPDETLDQSLGTPQIPQLPGVQQVAQSQATPGAASQSAAGPMPTGSLSPKQDTFNADAETDDLLADLSGGPSPELESSLAALDEVLGVTETGPGAGGWNRFRTSFGRTEQEKVSILQRIYGEKNVRNRDGVLQFRRGGDRKWQSVEGDQGINEFFGDLADMAGPAVQLGTQIGVSGAAAAASGLNPIPAAIAAGTVGPAAGEAVRAAGARLMGATPDEDYSAIKNAARDMAWDLALPAAQIAAGAGRGLYRAAKNFAANTVEKRVEKLVDVRRALDEVLGSVNFKQVDNVPVIAGEVGPKVASNIEKAGARFKDVLDQKHSTLANAVGLVDEAAIAAAGDAKFMPNRVIESMQDLINRNGGTIDPSTGFFRPVPRASEGRALVKRAIDQGDEAVLPSLAEAGRAQDAFESSNGREFLADLVDDYNFMLAKAKTEGGLSMQDLLDKTRKYQGASNYSKFPTNDKMNEGLKSLANATAQDRNDVFKVVLKGTPQERVWDAAYGDFSRQIDDIASLKAVIKEKGSGEAIADALFKPYDAERIKKVKALVGENSEEWKQLRGSFINSKVDDAVDSNGIFDGKKFIDSMAPKKLGAAFVEELGGQEVVNRLRRVAQYAETIQTADLVNSRVEKALDNTVGQLVMNATSGGRLARTLMKFTGGNVPAVGYLIDDGLLKAAKMYKGTPAEEKIIQALDVMRKTAERSKVANIRGIRRFVPAAPAAARAIYNFQGEVSRDAQNKNEMNEALGAEVDAPAAMPGEPLAQ